MLLVPPPALPECDDLLPNAAMVVDALLFWPGARPRSHRGSFPPSHSSSVRESQGPHWSSALLVPLELRAPPPTRAQYKKEPAGRGQSLLITPALVRPPARPAASIPRSSMYDKGSVSPAAAGTMTDFGAAPSSAAGVNSSAPSPPTSSALGGGVSTGVHVCRNASTVDVGLQRATCLKPLYELELGRLGVPLNRILKRGLPQRSLILRRPLVERIHPIL